MVVGDEHDVANETYTERMGPLHETRPSYTMIWFHRITGSYCPLYKSTMYHTRSGSLAIALRVPHHHHHHHHERRLRGMDEWLQHNTSITSLNFSRTRDNYRVSVGIRVQLNVRGRGC